MEDAKRMVDLWTENRLSELRLTDGKPTLWNGIAELVKYAKARGTQSVGISTNGFSDLALYNELIDAGFIRIAVLAIRKTLITIAE